MNATCEKRHAFETAGLGLAPFRFVGCVEKKYQACHGAPIQPGGTCDFCGNAIMECCVIISSDGRTFMVGSVCVYKTGDAGLVRVVKADERRRKAERDAARIVAARQTIARDDVRSALAAKPHPMFDDSTLLNWCLWMLDHAGTSGRIKAARSIEQAAKTI